MKFFSAAAALLAAVPFTNAYWKGFNIAANNPDGSCKTQAQWASAFQNLSSLPGHFTSVRLYASSDCNTLALAVPAALSTGTQLLVGVWAEDAAHFKAEKDALESAIKRYGQDWIIAISVGSEDLYRKDTNPGALAQKIYDVRGMVRAMGVKKDVGHVDTWTAWVDGANTEVIKASDFIGLGKSKPTTWSSCVQEANQFQTHTRTSKEAVSRTRATPSGAQSTRSETLSIRSLLESGFGSLRLAGPSAVQTTAMVSPVLRTLKHSGSRSPALPSSRSTSSGMFTRTTKNHPVLVSSTVTERPSTTFRTVRCWIDEVVEELPFLYPVS